MLVFCLDYSLTLKMEVTCSSKTLGDFQQIVRHYSQKIEFFVISLLIIVCMRVTYGIIQLSSTLYINIPNEQVIKCMHSIRVVVFSFLFIYLNNCKTWKSILGINCFIFLTFIWNISCYDKYLGNYTWDVCKNICRCMCSLLFSFNQNTDIFQ
jgi:hypothetical protein